MDNLDFKLTDESVVSFVNMVRDIAHQECQTMLKSLGIEIPADVQVISVSSDGLSANVKDAATGEVFNGIPNHTGARLHIGDMVRMYISQSGNYIGLTFGDRTDGLYKEYVDNAIREAKLSKDTK